VEDQAFAPGGERLERVMLMAVTTVVPASRSPCRVEGLALFASFTTLAGCCVTASKSGGRATR
jgi:hypothetical protein